jgi:two-component system response regulator FlrC
MSVVELSTPQLIGKNFKFQKAMETARTLAVSKTPLLVVGESGTGKKALCTYIHQNSARKDKPLIFVDCSLDIEEVQKEILGHRDVDGKFQRGVLERANGGMVVFSHIDALDEVFQKKVFSILSELTDYDIDIRLIATTDKNLSKMVAAGRFSRPLYSFFGNSMIGLPSLRERTDDIHEIVEYYGNLFANKHEKGRVEFTDDVINKFQGNQWSKNFNELKDLLENAVINATNNVIDSQALELAERKAEGRMLDDEDSVLKLMSLRDAEKLLIRKALIYTSENRTQAAKILGVSIRTLRNKINEYRTEGTEYFINLR